MTSFRWSRVRSSRLAESPYLKNVILRISERRESRGPEKPCALAHEVSCPANAEQGMNSLPANDATGQNFLPRKNGRVHDLVTCQRRKKGMFFLPVHRTAASELDPTSEIPLGVSLRALSRASSACFGSREHRREARSSKASPEVSQVFRRSSTQPVALWLQFPSRASTCFSLTARKLEFLAAPTFLQCLS